MKIESNCSTHKIKPVWRIFTSTCLADFIQALAVLHPPYVAYPDLGHDVGRAGGVIWGQKRRWKRGTGRDAGTRGWGGVVSWRLKVGEEVNKEWSRRENEEEKLINYYLLNHADKSLWNQLKSYTFFLLFITPPPSLWWTASPSNLAIWKNYGQLVRHNQSTCCSSFEAYWNLSRESI